MRDHIDQPLQQERRLRPPGAAIGIHRDGVGEHRLHLGVDRRGLVTAGEQGGVQVSRHAGREGREIGAHVGERPDAQRQEVALRVQRHLGRRVVVAPVRVGHEAFRPLGGPLHRPAHLARRPGDDRLLGVVEDLGAEPAAHVGRHDAQLVLRDVQHEGAHQQADDVRVLAGGVEREIPARRIEVADRRARLHRVRDQPVVHQVELHDLGRAGERPIDRVFVAEVPVVADVAGHLVMHRRRAGRDGVAQVGDGGKVVEVDDELLGRVLRLLARLGDHDGDGVADMAHLADSEHGMRRLGHRRAVLVVDLPAAGHAADVVGLHVGAGEHRDHARPGLGGRGIDAGDPRVRPLGAADEGIELSGPVDVVGVGASPAQEPHILLAAD